MTTATLDIPVRPVYKTKWLFHYPAFLRKTDGGSLRTFYQYSENEVLGMLRCSVSNGTADAAREGFYGCMELQSRANAGRLLDYIDEDIPGSGISSLAITLFPEQYDQASWQRQRSALREHNYRLDGSFTHRLIAVTADDDEPLANNDWRSADSSITEFSVSQEPLDQFQKISQLLQRSGLIEGANGERELAEYFLANIPENVLLFSVRDGARYCGLGVFLQAGNGILYTLYLAQLDEYSGLKPMMAQFQFVYEWAELNDVRYIDMGQISIGLRMNIGMIQGTAERWVKRW